MGSHKELCAFGIVHSDFDLTKVPSMCILQQADTVPSSATCTTPLRHSHGYFKLLTLSLLTTSLEFSNIVGYYQDARSSLRWNMAMEDQAVCCCLLWWIRAIVHGMSRYQLLNQCLCLKQVCSGLPNLSNEETRPTGPELTENTWLVCWHCAQEELYTFTTAKCVFCTVRNYSVHTLMPPPSCIVGREIVLTNSLELDFNIGWRSRHCDYVTFELALSQFILLVEVVVQCSMISYSPWPSSM